VACLPRTHVLGYFSNAPDGATRSVNRFTSCHPGLALALTARGEAIHWLVMGHIRPPRRVKLICGMIGPDHDLMRRAAKMTTHAFGEIDLTSEVWAFNATDYYEVEMGPDLKRWFVSFRELISPERIAEIKRLTMATETRLAEECLRPASQRVVNLDPGYVDLSKLVLATTKDHAHRIYLDRGIYAEVTLRFHQGRWTPWPWTYPDYAAETYHAFFVQVRQRLVEQLHGP